MDQQEPKPIEGWKSRALLRSWNDGIDWLHDVPVYHALSEVERDLQRAIRDEKADANGTHEVSQRDRVLAGLIAMLAQEGYANPTKERILRILDVYCGKEAKFAPFYEQERQWGELLTERFQEARKIREQGAEHD